MIMVGIAVSLLIHLIKGSGHIHNDHNYLLDYLTSIIITVFVWEGNLYIDRWMNIQYPWVSKPGKRVMFHFPIIMLYSAITIYLSMMAFDCFVCKFPYEAKKSFMITAIVVGVLVSIILLSVEISVQFFTHWKNSLIEVEKHKKESFQAQFQNLKNQINPHFLFNNLSVLSSLVYQNQDKAVDFINQLSKVYRYLLDNKDNELVTLDNELTFIKSYTYLLKIRFDENIIFKFNISEDKLGNYIPPMALQMLVENAIKHNEISSEKPLTVSVTIEHEMLVVSNNLQLRSSSEPSSKTGLKNIRDRYKHFTERTIEAMEGANSFIVKIPLLPAK